MATFLYIILAIAILLVMVIIHEFGHYIAGKILKFKINEFSVGFGPKIFGMTKKNGEVFSLRLIPLGGYCAFEGETDTSDNPEVKSFVDEKPWKRIIVLLAGGVANILSAVIFSFLFILVVGHATPRVIKNYYCDISHEIPYCELMEGDEILKVNGKKINVMHSFEDCTSGLGEGDTVTFAIKREGKTQDIEVTVKSITLTTYTKDESHTVVCEYCNAPNEIVTKSGEQEREFFCEVCRNTLVSPAEVQTDTYSGFGFQSTRVYRNKSVGSAFAYCIPFTGKMSWAILGSLFDMVTGKVSVTAMTGPVGTVSMMASMSKLNWRNIFILLPLIASNLGIFNLLPIPALDGSKVVFTIIEWIRGKPINRKVENYIHTVGLIVLMLLVVVLDVVGMVMRA